MTTYFIKNGSRFMLTDKANIDIRDRLPLGTYTVAFSPMSGYYLEQAQDFVIPPKLYGSVPRTAERIMNSFIDRPVNTGVLLAGEKGSGKTMLMRQLSLMAKTIDVPTLIVNNQYAGDDFNKFITAIEQPVVICFDEFEKVYEDEAQMAMLTLLDGVFTSKKLFVFTVNAIHKINSHMKNRPGRLFYNIAYYGLEEEMIRDYCKDTLRDQSVEALESLLLIAKSIDAFNFDMLKALVEEMNRFDEYADKAVKLLNVRPEKNDAVKYKVRAKMLAEPLKIVSVHGSPQNPLAHGRTDVTVYWPSGKKDWVKFCSIKEGKNHGIEEGDPRYKKDGGHYWREHEPNEQVQLVLTPQDVSGLNEAMGDIKFQKQGFEITFERHVSTSYSYGAYSPGGSYASDLAFNS